jgi:hypothetical protein
MPDSAGEEKAKTQKFSLHMSRPLLSSESRVHGWKITEFLCVFEAEIEI